MMLTNFLQRSFWTLVVLTLFALTPIDRTLANSDYVCVLDLDNECVCEWGDWFIETDDDGEEIMTRECSGTRKVIETWGNTRVGCPTEVIDMEYTVGTTFRYGGVISEEEVSCVIRQSDGEAPELETPPQIFAASYSKPGIIEFSDDTAGVAEIITKIEAAENGNEVTYSSTNSNHVNVSGHDFSEAKDYDLIWQATDGAGNQTDWETETGFFHVVANVPEWINTNCQQAYQANCPSQVELSSGTKIADGVQNHFVKASLVDRYGNQIVPDPGIKNVSVSFDFENTTRLNQIAIPPTGKSAFLVSDEFPAITGDQNSTGLFSEGNNADGAFEIKVYSYAPTSTGFSPIANDGFEIILKEFTFDISAIDPLYQDIGAAAGYFSAENNPNQNFAFAPTLVVIPDGLIWDGTNYILDALGVENITVNAIKRFIVGIQNDSDDVDALTPQIGIALASGDDSNITWSEGKIERIGTSGNLDADLSFDTDGNENFNGDLFDLNSWTGSIAKTITTSLRFRTTPLLEPGVSISGDMAANLDSYTCYTISDQYVCHRGYSLLRDLSQENEGDGDGGTTGDGDGGSGDGDGSGTGGDGDGSGTGGDGDGSSTGGDGDGSSTGGDGDATANIYNPGIEILGSIRSIAGTASKQTDTAINQSIGDFIQSEFQDAMRRNLASLLNNSSRACNSDMTITSAAEFEELDCRFNDDSVVYFQGADLTINLADGELPDEAWTIVIEDGDLSIKSNLEYPSRNSSLGIIVLRGDIFVYPEATNLVGAVYAEGGVISVNENGEYGEDSSANCSGMVGFCDRSYELRNQLYWKGLLATSNTIGGSDKITYECPSHVSNCNSRDTARVYDLAYLRTFHPSSGGKAAIDATSDASFIIEYDSRIQNNPPPLFESATGIQTNELGTNLIQVLRSLWPL